MPLNLKIFCILIFILCFCMEIFPQANTDFRLENIQVKSGEKATGFVLVPDGIDKGTQIPVSIFHGKNKGRVFVIMAGLHGSEYSPILALQRLAKQIDPQKLSGTIILIHVANVPSFLKRTIYYGMDEKNLNRVFPGKENGTITERIAFTLIEKIIKRGDFLIDVHSGDNNEALRPYVVYYDAPQADQKNIEISRQMAISFGIDYVKKSKLTEFDYEKSTYGTRAALILGKTVIAVESGQLGQPDEKYIQAIEQGLLNVLRQTKFIEGKPSKVKKPTLVKYDQTIRTGKTGLFFSLVKLDQKVKKDQLVGYVTDFFGKRIEEVKAPFDGIVMYFTATPPVSEGEPLINIGQIETNQ